MNKEKEIEEMARVICPWHYSECKDCPCKPKNRSCVWITKVRKLQNAGYGNVKQAVKEFKEQVKIELEKYRLDNEEKTNEGFVFNSSQFCVEVICDGGLIDEAFEKLYGEDKEKPFNIDDYKDGETFTYKGIEFVRLGEEQGGVLAIKKEPTHAMRFGDNNDYRESEVKDYIEQDFLPRLDKSDLLPYEMDLIADNGDKAYGKYTAYAGIISCDTYRKYRDYIPLPDDDIFAVWTCTPWSASSGNPSYVRSCGPAGGLGSNSAYVTYGVSPACIFKKPAATVGGKE